MNTRTVEKVFTATDTRDGDGVRIRRIAHRGDLAALDPFLMVDELAGDDAADYIGGFPEHPHRGFETVTLMLEGRMRHRDSLGNEGVVGPGDVQWISAARGVLHSEMPEQDHGRLHGFQLWVNLPAARKMAPPAYREIQAADIPHWRAPGVTARVIAGSLGNVQGVVQDVPVRPLLADITLATGARLQLPVPATATVLVYIYAGGVVLPADNGSGKVAAGQLASLSAGSDLSLRNDYAGDSRLLLLAGDPIGENVVQYGPFVMNSREEIEQALRDYRDGKLVA